MNDHQLVSKNVQGTGCATYHRKERLAPRRHHCCSLADGFTVDCGKLLDMTQPLL